MIWFVWENIYSIAMEFDGKVNISAIGKQEISASWPIQLEYHKGQPWYAAKPKMSKA
jgi:hypothetical protein